MKLIKFLILFVCCIQTTRAQFGDGTCANSNFKEIASLSAKDYKDLAFLKKKVQGKRIVLLGESSHTIGDYYQMKTRLVKFLHEECGFEVFAMESGFADVYSTYLQIDTLSGKQLMDKTLFANLACKEMLPLFNYLKENVKGNNPLKYCGFDSQNHGSSLDLLKAVLHSFYGQTSDSLITNLNKYYQTSQLAWQPDKTPIIKLCDTIMSSADQLIALFKKAKPQIAKKYGLTDMHLNILEKSLYSHKESVNINWNTDNPLERRDSLMAENVMWLANELFPDKKMVVWAHNLHIDKGETDAVPKSMGYHLNKRMKNQTYHIGLYAKTGELYFWWAKQTRSFNNNQQNDIETFADKYPITFFEISKHLKKCRALTKTFMGYEAEFNRKIAFIPSARYDAIINFRSVAASTY